MEPKDYWLAVGIDTSNPRKKPFIAWSRHRHLVGLQAATWLKADTEQNCFIEYFRLREKDKESGQ